MLRIVDGVVVEMTANEVAQREAEEAAAQLAAQDDAAAAVRVERDRRLDGCDWTQLADAPVTAAQAEVWRTYRQALRDLPQLDGFPWAGGTVPWPEEPVGA